MKILLWLSAFVALSLCHNPMQEIDQIKLIVKALTINPAAPYTTFTLPPGQKLSQPHLVLSSTEIVFNPCLITGGYEDSCCTEEALMYVMAPVKLEACQRLLELGAESEYLFSLFRALKLNNFAFTGVELVQSGLLKPERMWKDAIDSDNTELFNYLLHERCADLSLRIPYSGCLNLSLIGYCIFKGRIEFLKSLLSSGASLFDPPTGMPRDGLVYIFSPDRCFIDFDEPLAAALEPYLKCLESAEWDTSDPTILDMVAFYGNRQLAPPETVRLLMRYKVPSKYPLTLAIKYGQREAIMPLIRSNPHETCPVSDPPISLLLLSRTDFTEEISELLARGAELQIESKTINSAQRLQMFQDYMRPDHYIVAAMHLIRRGRVAPADFMRFVIEYNRLDMFFFVQEQGADPHDMSSIVGCGSYSALGWSVRCDRVDMVRMMLSLHSFNLDALHYRTSEGTDKDFWSLLMGKSLSFITAVFADIPSLLDAFVRSLLMEKALRSLNPSFVPEFLRLLRKRVTESSFPLETYKQTNADGWTILDLIAFHPHFSFLVDSDLIRILHSAGIPTKHFLALTLKLFEPHELLPLILNPSINPNERTVPHRRHIIVQLLRLGRPWIPEIVTLVRSGAQLHPASISFIDARAAMKRIDTKDLEWLRDELSRVLDSEQGTRTCFNLIQMIASILSERPQEK